MDNYVNVLEWDKRIPTALFFFPLNEEIIEN